MSFAHLASVGATVQNSPQTAGPVALPVQADSKRVQHAPAGAEPVVCAVIAASHVAMMAVAQGFRGVASSVLPVRRTLSVVSSAVIGFRFGDDFLTTFCASRRQALGVAVASLRFAWG